MNTVLLAGLFPLRLALYELTRAPARLPARVTIVNSSAGGTVEPVHAGLSSPSGRQPGRQFGLPSRERSRKS